MKAEVLFEDFAKAMEQFRAALSAPAGSDLVKAGCIQYFEFTFEVAWKSIKVAAQRSGLPDCLSPKSCLRTAFQQGWISDESVWLDMLEDRNKMSHTYHADEALEVYDRLKDYQAPLQNLSLILKNLN